MYNGELLAIVEAFKTWRHYLEGSRHEVLMLTNHNNLQQFMDTKSLSSKQVRWAQKLFCYHFQIDYCQGKANEAADTLFQYPQRSVEEEKTLRAENVKILHHLQSLLTNTSLSSLTVSKPNLSLLHQVLVCRTHVLPQLHHFWTSLQSDIAWNGLYASIGDMNLRLPKLQDNNKEAKMLRTGGLLKGWKDVKEVLQYQKLPYVPEIIRSEVINRHHNDLLSGHFGINKTKELVSQKYYWPSLKRDVESYVQGCDVCLALKTVRHKFYSDLQSLPVPTYRWKDLFMDFVTRLPLFSDWKSDSYDFIFVIVNQLTKMVYYKLVKVTISIPGLAEVIINVVIQYHGLPDSIISDWGAVFTSKFWSSLCHFLGIKRRLSIAFHA